MYRSEIDGLRALAVMPVIFFHAGFNLFEGGFVGVDVFFVISGYLITNIIISEIEDGQFSLSDFYERRARRILPALFFMMAICIPFSIAWMIPNYLKDFGQSLVATSFFLSNILFWIESGYFETTSELKPLLHTWSLAIEEQYYILFPIFMLLAWRLGIKYIFLILLIIFITSFSLAAWGSLNKPSASYYLLPTRGWEILIGVFISIFLRHRGYFKSYLVNEVFSILGIVFILYAIFFLNNETPLRGYFALLPTLGAGLVILTAVPNTIVNRILSFNTLFFWINFLQHIFMASTNISLSKT